MESTRQKTFELLGITLSGSVVSLFILRLSSAHSTYLFQFSYESVEIKSYDTDRYGRILGVVYCKITNVNLEMIKAGLAGLYSGKPAKISDSVSYWRLEKGGR